jgi:hypothetical protein
MDDHIKKNLEEFIANGKKFFYDKKLLREMEDFRAKRDIEMFKPILYGTAGDENEIPYDMEPEDYRNRKAEKMIEMFKNAGIQFIDPPYRVIDPKPYIVGNDPYDPLDGSQMHIFSTKGIQVVNPGVNFSLKHIDNA